MTDYRNDSIIGDDIDGYAAASELDTPIAGSPATDALRTQDGIRAKADALVGKAEAAVAERFGEPAARRVRDTADAAIIRAEDAADLARQRLDQELAARPYRTLAVAAGAGLVLGLWLSRR